MEIKPKYSIQYRFRLHKYILSKIQERKKLNNFFSNNFLLINEKVKAIGDVTKSIQS